MKMSIVDARRIALVVGIASLIACAIGWAIDRREFFVSYLFAFLFWLGIALGCSGFLMIHHLTAGRWGYPIRRFLEAAISTLPFLAGLFVPILFGLAQLYPWATLAHVSIKFCNINIFMRTRRSLSFARPSISRSGF